MNAPASRYQLDLNIQESCATLSGAADRYTPKALQGGAYIKLLLTSLQGQHVAVVTKS